MARPTPTRNPMILLALLTTGCWLGVPPALASFLDEPSQARLDLSPKPTQESFAQEGTHWGALALGYTNNLDSAHDFNLHFAYSYFLAEDFELAGELGAWYYDQPGDNAAGFNPAFVFRYHFYHERNITMYADVGMGLLFATDDVPSNGTSFNFTPRVGVGFTYALDDTIRLQMGLRWSHVSNARITGNENNPSRDGPMLYVGLIFPF